MTETVSAAATEPVEGGKKRCNDEMDQDLQVSIDEPATKRAAHANGVARNGHSGDANGSASADDSGSYTYSYSYSVSEDAEAGEAGKDVADGDHAVKVVDAEPKGDADEESGSGSYTYSYSYSASGSGSDSEDDDASDESGEAGSANGRRSRPRRETKQVDRYRDEDYPDEDEDDKPRRRRRDTTKNYTSKQKTLADSNLSSGLCKEDGTFVVYARPVAVDLDGNGKPLGIVCGIMALVHMITDSHMHATAELPFEMPNLHCCDVPKYVSKFSNRAEKINFRHRAQDSDSGRKVSRLELIVNIRGANDAENRLLADRASPYCIFPLRVRMSDDHIGWDALPAASIGPNYAVRHLRLPYGIPLGQQEAKRHTLEARTTSKERAKANICLAGTPLCENAAFSLQFHSFERVNWIDETVRVIQLGSLRPLFFRMPAHVSRTTTTRPFKAENYCMMGDELQINPVDVRFGLVCGGVAIDTAMVPAARLRVAIQEFIRLQKSSGAHACVGWASKIRFRTSIIARLLAFTTMSARVLLDHQRPVVQRNATAENARALLSWSNECKRELNQDKDKDEHVALREPASALGRALMAPMLGESFWTLASYVSFGCALIMQRSTEWSLWAETAIAAGSAYAIFLHRDFFRLDPDVQALETNEALVERLISEAMLAHYSRRKPSDLTAMPPPEDIANAKRNVTSVDFHAAKVLLFQNDNDMQRVKKVGIEALLSLRKLAASLCGDGALLYTEQLTPEEAERVAALCAPKDANSPLVLTADRRVCYRETVHTVALMCAVVDRQPPHIILRDDAASVYAQWATRVHERCAFGGSALVVGANSIDLDACRGALSRVSSAQLSQEIKVHYLLPQDFIQMPIDQIPRNDKSFVAIARADLFDGQLFAGLLAVLARVGDRADGETFENRFGDVELKKGHPWPAESLPLPAHGAPPLLCAVRYAEVHKASGGALLEALAEKVECCVGVDIVPPLRVHQLPRLLEEGVDMHFCASNTPALATQMFSMAANCCVLRSEHGSPNSTGVALTVSGISMDRARVQRLDSNDVWQTAVRLPQDAPPKNLCVVPCSRFNPLWIPCFHQNSSEWSANERVRFAARVALRCCATKPPEKTSVHVVYSRDHFEQALDEADPATDLRLVIGGKYPPIEDLSTWIKATY